MIKTIMHANLSRLYYNVQSFNPLHARVPVHRINLYAYVFINIILYWILYINILVFLQNFRTGVFILLCAFYTYLSFIQLGQRWMPVLKWVYKYTEITENTVGHRRGTILTINIMFFFFNLLFTHFCLLCLSYT